MLESRFEVERDNKGSKKNTFIMCLGVSNVIMMIVLLIILGWFYLSEIPRISQTIEYKLEQGLKQGLTQGLTQGLMQGFKQELVPVIDQSLNRVIHGSFDRVINGSLDRVINGSLDRLVQSLDQSMEVFKNETFHIFQNSGDQLLTQTNTFFNRTEGLINPLIFRLEQVLNRTELLLMNFHL